MRWGNATLVSYEKCGEDSLGNTVKNDKEVAFVKARFTPWTEQDVSVDVRKKFLESRKILLRIKIEDLPICDKIKFDRMYTIKSVKPLAERYVCLYVERYDS